MLPLVALDREFLHAAGGKAAPARRLRWEDVAEETPEVVVFMPCGYGLDEAVAEGQGLLDVPALAAAARIYAADANAYFSRPGPRVVDGVEALARALHPEPVSALRSGAISALRA
jgi:iron complex transport system substrate-binding protein